jgi:energy-coupling factor transporter ATP-binding protein EcfA2
MQGPEFYSCGRLKLVTGETGCGKSHVVKEWLRNKPQNGGRVVVVGIPEEYEEFLWRPDVAVVSCRDAELNRYLRVSEAVKLADVVVLDMIPYALSDVVLHLLTSTNCQVMLVCTEGLDALNMPLELQWERKSSFSEFLGVA